MAYGQAILDRLISLEGTNFEVRDVKVTPELIIWQIEHKEDPEYILSRFFVNRTFDAII